MLLAGCCVLVPHEGRAFQQTALQVRACVCVCVCGCVMRGDGGDGMVSVRVVRLFVG